MTKEIKDEKEEIKVENINTPDEKEEKDMRSLGEKIEDGMDEVVANVQDFFYGERKSTEEDIPATMVDPDTEIRKVMEVQTRRNISRKVMKSKLGKVLLIILGIGLAMTLIMTLISKLLMA